MGLSPLRTTSNTFVCLKMVASCWVTGDRVSHPVCCAMVWVGFVFVRVSSPRYRQHPLNWAQVSLPRGHRCIWCILRERGSSGVRTMDGIG